MLFLIIVCYNKIGDNMGLDIIIPAYNAKDTLFYTLSSIAVQRGLEKVDFHVTIVNDCSEYSYSSFIDYFSPYMNIQEIVTDKNVGPGEARNLGLKSTKQEYIIFIDSDDCFYSSYSIKKLYDEIQKHDYDLVISDFILERDNKREIKNNNLVWLHGKIYRRSFLKKYDIHFNNSRANEDNGFNRLILLMNPKRKFLPVTTYVYRENSSSITRKDDRLYRLTGLEGYIYNMNWAAEEALKRNCEQKEVVILAMNVLIHMYYYYMELYNKYDVTPILKWSHTILELYRRFPNLSVSEGTIRFFLELREKEYIQNKIKFDRVLTFSEFLSKVGEAND